MQHGERSRSRAGAARRIRALVLAGLLLAFLPLMQPDLLGARAEDERPTLTWSTIEDGHENLMAVGISSIISFPKTSDAPAMQIRRLGVRGTYPQPVSGTLVILHRRPGSDVEWPVAFHLYLEASPPGRISVANYMIAFDVSPLEKLGTPPPAPRDLRVRAYLLDMKRGAEARPLAGEHIQRFDPVFDSVDEGLRQLYTVQWARLPDPFVPGEEGTARDNLIFLGGAYWSRRRDPVARATAIALFEYAIQIGTPGMSWHLAVALRTPVAPPEADTKPGLHWVPVADPAEADRKMERAARVEGEPLAWYHIFKTSPDEEERFVYALLLRTWEQRCPGDRFEGIEEVLQGGSTRWTNEEGMKLMVRAIRLGAEAGFAETQVQLSKLYFEGAGGLAEDLQAAKDWAFKAAQQGHIEGMNLFGNLLLRLLRRKEIDLAAEYFEMAAKFGHPHAAFSLASMHFRAMLGLPDNEKAAYWLSIAARLKHPQAVTDIDQLMARLSEEQRKSVTERVDAEMKEIAARLKTLAKNIQKQRRTGKGREHLWD